MLLTILMPCLNEAETLATCIHKANAWRARAGILDQSEVLVADNGSVDGSQDIASSLGARIIAVGQKGYGNALFYGCLDAKGQYVIMGDSDDSYDFSDLDLFLEKLLEGYDLVMGNRFLGGIAPGAMPWKNKYIGNPILTWVGRLLFSCSSNDFHCGLRGVNKDAFMRMDLRTTGMEFASEMVIKASIFDMKVAEVPTTLAKDGRSRPPHLRPWRDGWRHLRFMLLFSPVWLFIIPGALLFCGGVFIYAPLFIAPIRLGDLSLDIHTLLYAQAAILLGFLSIVLGLIIRVFGAREGLLRKGAAVNFVLNSPILEWGGGLGLAMIVAGLYFGFSSLLAWSEVNFGLLEQGALMRIVSLSTLMVMLGGITLMSSLILGFLALPTQKKRI